MHIVLDNIMNMISIILFFSLMLLYYSILSSNMLYDFCTANRKMNMNMPSSCITEGSERYSR